MRRDVGALWMELTKRQAVGFGGVFRGVFAARVACGGVRGSGVFLGRFGRLGFGQAVLVTVERAGTGTAEVCSIGGCARGGNFEGNLSVECFKNGGFEVCNSEIASFEGSEGIYFTATADAGSEILSWEVIEGGVVFGCTGMEGFWFVGGFEGVVEVVKVKVTIGVAAVVGAW